MSVQDSLSAVVDANIETIDQGLVFLAAIRPETYTARSDPYASSTIGEHIRHLVDMYHALIDGESTGIVDFNRRRRGAPIETSLSQALTELSDIKAWLQGPALNDDELQVVTEVALGKTKTVMLGSTLMRELVFTSSHAVHHFALIATIARLQGVEVGADLGVAAATASYRRQVSADNRSSLLSA